MFTHNNTTVNNTIHIAYLGEKTSKTINLG